MLHPVYDDEQEVSRLTSAHLAAGRSVLQMFQLADTEQNHSIRVLEMLQLPENSRVLSLGCGVAGMERYWHQWRDDLGFELVNRSQAQLDLCVCPWGRRVCADLHHYRSTEGLFDCTVLAYVLGHVDAELALDTARENTKPGGKVVVLDIFDGTEQFDAYFHYATVESNDMRAWGFVERTATHPWRLMPLIHISDPWVPRHVTPGLWTREV